MQTKLQEIANSRRISITWERQKVSRKVVEIVDMVQLTIKGTIVPRITDL